MVKARDAYRAMGGKDAEWQPRVVVDGEEDDASAADDAEGVRRFGYPSTELLMTSGAAVNVFETPDDVAPALSAAASKPGDDDFLNP
jgi:hypothetical protein